MTQDLNGKSGSGKKSFRDADDKILSRITSQEGIGRGSGNKNGYRFVPPSRRHGVACQINDSLHRPRPRIMGCRWIKFVYTATAG